MNRSLDFGKLLRKFRKEKSITQEKLAKKLGRSKSYISRLEKKDNIVGTNKIRKIRELLDNISTVLKLDNTERLKLKISSGIMPSELLDCLSDQKVVELFADLVDLSEDERKKQVEELNISLGFLRHFFFKERVKKP